MTNRREFLQIGLAATALPVAGGLLASAADASVAARAPAISLYKILFDAEFAQGRRFGDAAARLGIPFHAMARGDVTDFWYHDLDLAWREAPKAIAGFTRHGPLFVLERLAWDRSLRVVLRAEHRPAGDGVIEHVLTGPSASVARAAALVPAGDEWMSVMAGVVAQCAAGCSETTTQTVVTRTRQSLPDNEPFYSWVIAPRV
jgi:hypothetical protein